MESFSHASAEKTLKEKGEEVRRSIEVDIAETKKRGKKTLAAAKFWLSRAILGIAMGSGVLISRDALNIDLTTSSSEQVKSENQEQLDIENKLFQQFGDSYLFIAERDREIPHPVIIDGFNEAQGINEEVVKEAVCNLPSGFYENIKDVSFVDRREPSGQQYGLSEDWVTDAEADRITGSITFFKHGVHDMQEHWGRSNFLEIFLHESGHLIDWEGNRFLKINDRLRLLEIIGKRLQSPDRYHSDYVESIHNENQYNEQYLKATEYFAEIVKVYFSSPDELTPEDFTIVDIAIRMINPNFDAPAARKAYAAYVFDGRFPPKKP